MGRSDESVGFSRGWSIQPEWALREMRIEQPSVSRQFRFVTSPKFTSQVPNSRRDPCQGAFRCRRDNLANASTNYTPIFGLAVRRLDPIFTVTSCTGFPC